MNSGIAFLLGIWAATTYERKGWRGFFKYFVVPIFIISLIGAVVIIYYGYNIAK
nr:MAG TPA: hypothetical protein [Inoviridae sp.]